MLIVPMIFLVFGNNTVSADQHVPVWQESGVSSAPGKTPESCKIIESEHEPSGVLTYSHEGRNFARPIFSDLCARAIVTKKEINSLFMDLRGTIVGIGLQDDPTGAPFYFSDKWYPADSGLDPAQSR